MTKKYKNQIEEIVTKRADKFDQIQCCNKINKNVKIKLMRGTVKMLVKKIKRVVVCL